MRCRATATARDAIALINAAERPLILAGHGVMLSGAERADRSSSPSARRFRSRSRCSASAASPASHPLNLGMMGMHGEAWVNNAIQEADLLIALGMRFDDRVTGNLKTYARNAKKIHVDIDRAELNKNVRVDVGDRQGSARGARRVAAARRRRRSLGRGSRTSTRSRATPRSATSRTCPTTGISTRRTSSTTSGASPTATRWSSPTSASTRCGKRSTTSTIARGRSSPRADSARWASRCRRRSAPRSRCPDAEVWVVVGDGGFQMTMPELATLRAGEPRHQHRDHQQRLPRHGPAVAGVLLRQALRGDADHRAGLRQAGRRVRHRGDDASPSAPTSRARWQAARRLKRAALIDFQVEQEDSVYPMVPAGADLHKMIRRPSPIVETAAD